MGKTVKEAESLKLPIKAGESVEIKLLDDKVAVTRVTNIISAIYQNSYLYITFETKNSIYKDIPVKANYQEDFYDGQVIKSGELITTSDGEYLTISNIVEINNKGIILTTEEDTQTMIGEIELG